MTESPQPFRSWAICEQMGHRRIAGLVTADAPLLHATRLVIEVYDGDSPEPAATIGTGYPVYQLTACTEELARRLGTETLRSDMPVSQWDARSLLPQPEPVSRAALPPGRGGFDPEHELTDAELAGDEDEDDDIGDDDLDEDEIERLPF